MTERQWIQRQLARPVLALLSGAAALYDVADIDHLDPDTARDIAAALRDCVTDIEAEIARYEQRAGETA